jgi:predicted PurR-regulated permease PerM
MNSTAPQPISHWSARQVVYATLFVSSVLVSFLLLYRFSRVVIIFFIAIVLGTAIRPAVDWLSRRGISRTVGVILVYLSLFIVAIGLTVLILPIIADQATAILANTPSYLGDLRNFLFRSPSRVVQQIATQLPANISLLAPGTQADSGETLSQVAQFFDTARVFARSALTLAAVFLLGLYWTQEGDRAILNLLLWVPQGKRLQARQLIAEIQEKLGGFLLGQSLLCLAIGGLSLAAYVIIGLPYALVLAIIAGILEAVPIFGPILGAIPALLVALSAEPGKAVWVIGATIVIQGLENYLLVPGVMKRSVGINAMVTLLAIAALTSLLGLAGALLAIPLAAIIQLLLSRLITSADDQTGLQAAMGRDQVSVWRYEAQNLAQDARNRLRQNEKVDGASEEIVEGLEAIAKDLDRMLAETSQAEGEN